MSKPHNIIDKIWQRHIVQQTKGHPALFAIDFTLLHEVTSAQAFATLEARGLSLYNNNAFLATIDHSIPTRQNRDVIHDLLAKQQVATLRNYCQQFDITFYDFDSGHQGIVHVIGPELGITQPGMTLVCGDSHTSTHGAFGALAFGIGTTVLSHVMATGCILLKKPKVMRVEFNGHFKPGVYAKDAILKLIADIGIAGGNGHIIEYTGDAIRAMSMEERMTICNMSIECGAIAGIIAPDQTTYDYINNREYAPRDTHWTQAVKYWQTLPSDDGAHFDKTVTIDVGALAPMVSWGTNPEQTIPIDQPLPEPSKLPTSKQVMAEKAYAYVQLEPGTALQSVAIDWAFIGSCTNGRIEDLRIAAQILKGRKVNPQVTFYIVPGSEAVLAQAKAEGLDKIFQAAGADFRMPGCSMCLGMNDDKVPRGKRCISATNRNFVGRQGVGSITHLASPATVAASAVTGHITAYINLEEVIDETH